MSNNTNSNDAVSATGTTPSTPPSVAATSTTTSWGRDFWIDFVAGWCSGAVAVLACQPIDTILTIRQATAAAGAGGLRSPSPMVMAKSLVATNGMSSLWRGSSAMIGAVPLQNALLMTGYGVGKRWSDKENDDNKNNNKASSLESLWAVFVGGCTGGVIQSFLMSPVELVKVTQQVKGRSVSEASHSVVQGLARLPLRGGGASGWRGLNATLLRDGIPHGVWFVSYEYTKTMMSRSANNNNDDESMDSSFYTNVTVPLVSGATAATAAWGVGYPFDLIKTRIQASSASSTIWGTALELAREPGGGLYRGFGLKLIRAIPASAIGFTIYEMVQKGLSCVWVA